MTDRIVYKQSELFFYKEGTGRRKILLFHGFGQDHRAFSPWLETLADHYTVYAFDLFFHGNSKWENQQALRKEDWKEIMQLFFEREKMERFEMAGFSMGARFVLATLELFPGRVERLVLLAPDGITNHFWYRLATGTAIMRSFFRSLMLRPGRLQSIIKILKRFLLEDKRLLAFAATQLGTEEKRRRVYRAWIYFRLLRFRQDELTRLFNTTNITVTFVVGKTDHVVTAEKIKGFAKTLQNHQIRIIDSAHHDLISRGIECFT